MNQFSNSLPKNWKQNSLHSTALQTSMVNHRFQRVKMLISQTNIAKNAKKVTYSLHALNTRNVRQTKGMKFWARTIFARIVQATNILSSHVRPQNDAKHVKDFTTQLCMILRNKLSGPKLLSQQAISISRHKIWPASKPSHLLAQQQNQNKSTEIVNSKKRQHTRYGKSFSDKQQLQHQNIRRAQLNALNPTQNFSINRKTIPPPEWYEQLQILPVSFLNGSKVFDTYALIDPGSQFTFLLDRVTSFIELPCEAQASTTLQYLNTEQEMPLSKISETVTVTLFDKINQQFSIARAYSTPCLNVSPTNVLELNQLCDSFKKLSHRVFLDIANGAISALLGVNTFTFTYPVDVIQGSKKRPFGVKTKLGWTLVGEYDLSHQTMTANKPKRQRFIYLVCRKDIEEEPLD